MLLITVISKIKKSKSCTFQIITINKIEENGFRLEFRGALFKRQVHKKKLCKMSYSSFISNAEHLNM